jgi:hypothetical protein
MSESVAFCSACDRPVPVTPRTVAGDRTSDEPRQLVCLDYGRRCSGAFCPMMLWIPDEEGVQSAGLVDLSSARRPPLP